MKTKQLLPIAAVALLFTATSCQKQPQADFTIDKSSVNPSEKVSCKNTSTDADHYKWVLPDGQTSTASNLDITWGTPGTVNVKLQAYSKNNKKTAEATKSFLVKNFNELWTGTYAGNATTGCQITKLVSTINGSDRISLDVDGTLMTAKINSSTSATLDTYIEQDANSKITVNGVLTRSDKTINLNLTSVYVDYVDPSNNFNDNCISNVTK